MRECSCVNALTLDRAADKIVVINEGRVAEEGSHDALLAKVLVGRRRGVKGAGCKPKIRDADLMK